MEKTVYVGNVSWNLSDDDLKEAFSPFGEINSATIITDRNSGRSKGFGFVTFANAEDADTAIEEMHEKELDGRNIIVNEARPKE